MPTEPSHALSSLATTGVPIARTRGTAITPPARLIGSTTGRASVEPAGCCAPTEQATCCAPSEKATCCGTESTAGAECGCR